MSRICEYLRGISVLISDIALGCLLLALIPLMLKWDFGVALPVWIGFLCLQFLVNHIMMSVGAPTNLYLIFNAAAIAGGTYLTVQYSWCNPGYDEMRGFLAAYTCFTLVHSAFAAYRLPGSNEIIKYVDTLIVILAFYLFTDYHAGQQGNMDFVLLTLGAMALDLLVVNQLRTGEESGAVIQGAGTGGKVILLTLGLGCLAVTGVVVGRASGQIHSTVDLLLIVLGYLWNVIDTVLSTVGTVLMTIIAFFLMLSPTTPQYAREQMQENLLAEVEMAEQAGAGVPPWVFQVLVAIAAAALVGWILYQLRGTRLKRIRLQHQKRKIVRKSRFWSAIKKAVLRLWDWLELEVNYRRYKKTPEGLLVLAERVGVRSKAKRRENESPGEYMRRLAGILKSWPESEKNLSVLAEQLDRIYYAGECCKLESSEYKEYVREIQRLREVASG